MYHRIAVPLDETNESHHALNVAVSIAQKAGCPVDLIRVALPSTPGTELYALATLGSEEREAMRREAETRLRRTAAELESAGVATTVAVLEGDVPEALADHLQQSGADLVVMTTHDRGRLEHLLLGSVAESVVRRLHVPVVLVRGASEVLMIASAPDINRMLIALDGSAFGDQIVPHATTLAVLMGADVTLLTVSEPTLVATAPPSLVAPPGSALPSVVRVDDAHRTERESRRLEEMADDLRRRGVAVRSVVLSVDDPSRAIVSYAREHDIDLIAMTTHGRGALKRLVAGSVSQAVLRAAPTLMLMYRPDPHPAQETAGAKP